MVLKILPLSVHILYNPLPLRESAAGEYDQKVTPVIRLWYTAQLTLRKGDFL